MIKDFLYPTLDLFSFAKEDWGMLVLYIGALYAALFAFLLLK